jgi:hypothetical protein
MVDNNDRMGRGFIGRVVVYLTRRTVPYPFLCVWPDGVFQMRINFKDLLGRVANLIGYIIITAIVWFFLYRFYKNGQP